MRGVGIEVILVTNFSFVTGSGGQYSLPASVTTVADLLAHVGKQIEFLFMDAGRRNLRKDIELVLNGKDIWFYPGGLATALKEGDCIEITLMPLGGG